MYTPLKITTDYTLLGSLIKIKDLINFLVKNKIKACAICDDNLYGILDFYLNCKKNNIKPIVGLEINFNDHKLYLYAKDYEGYQNLLKIHTIKQERDIAIIDLEKYQKGILAIVPFASIDIFKTLPYSDIYLGYKDEYEKQNAQIMTDNNVYVNDTKALSIKDVPYLKYLDLLAERAPQNYDFAYFNLPTFAESQKIDEIVNKLNLEIPFNNRYIPQYKNDVDSKKFLVALANKGLNKRLASKVTSAYQARLNHELDIIIKMGFVDYFLIVYDYVLYAKKNGILVGCRGSAAGSLVSYAIGITDIDPLKYDLIFERFLNPARVTMPDIDIDFDAEKRADVIEYVKNKYGEKRVANGITYATLKAKLVLRDLAKVLKINEFVFNKFIATINASLTLQENYQNPVVKKYLQNYRELNRLYEIAIHLEGIKKNYSTHAAGVVISSTDLNDLIPVMEASDILRVPPMEFLENIGLLKMDFLGLKNLSFIAKVLKGIGATKFPNLNLEDKQVFAIFNNVDVDGIFQFETPTMKRFLEKFKITCFNDLIAALALVRPGPKDHIDTFIRRKNKVEEITYIHPSLESILKETKGIILYQEQIMEILRVVGGYSYQEADIIRRAISKKKEEIIKEEKAKFIKNAIKNGYTENIASRIYEEIAKFADYGFNKSHSVAYALLAYQMAYLKCYHYEYFILSNLNSGVKGDLTSYFAELKHHHIQILKPSVLNRNLEFVIKDNYLLPPLKIIKNITNGIDEKIVEVAKDGFKDYYDFVVKTKEFLDAEHIMILIKAGALDFLKLNHPTLINNLDKVLNYATLVEGDEALIEKPELTIYSDSSDKEKRDEELRTFGFYISNHPASKYIKNTLKIENMIKYQYKKVRMVVLIQKVQNIKTKKGEDMAFVTASDETGDASFTVFPKQYNLIKDLKVNDLVEVLGEVTKRFDKYQIIVNNIKKMEDAYE